MDERDTLASHQLRHQAGKTFIKFMNTTEALVVT
jgi:hypothetical protein